jgi:branched-chain amino acid transport system ATP-binding protein
MSFGRIYGIIPGKKDGSGRWPTEHMFEMFSNLSERADVEASVLSAAGEQ